MCLIRLLQIRGDGSVFCHRMLRFWVFLPGAFPLISVLVYGLLEPVSLGSWFDEVYAFIWSLVLGCWFAGGLWFLCYAGFYEGAIAFDGFLFDSALRIILQYCSGLLNVSSIKGRCLEVRALLA